MGNLSEMEKKLIEWFNKTGYPFELWTESILSKYDFNSVNSSLYKDQENDIFREIDLVSTRSWGSEDGQTVFTIKLIIECKKSDKPFVLLCNKEQKKCEIQLGEYYGIDDPISRMLFNNNSKSIELPKKSSYGFKLTQGFVKGDETSHKAINTLIKSLNEHLNNDKEYLGYYIESNQHSITIPLLLIDSPFFELKLSNDNELKTERINSGIVSTITHLSRFYPENFLVPIITKESFGNFLKTLEIIGKKNLKHLIENPLCNLRNYEKTKIVLVDKEKTMPNGYK